MSKVKIISLLGLVVTLIASMVVMPSCREETASESVTATETIVETVTETVEVETAESPFTYEKLREMAIAGVYEGEPAAGHTLAFANFLATFPFCRQVEDNIVEQWKLAGGSEDDLTILDNAYDTTIAIQNADIIFNKNPEVFIQFQADAKINAQIARRAKELGIQIIAIDVEVPGFPFMGINNYGTSILVGNWAISQIDEVYGGWENVDKVFFLWNPLVGETVSLRMWGAVDVFKETFGDEADPKKEGSKAIIVDAGSTTDEAGAAINDILAANPMDENFIVFCLNDQAGAGVQAAAEISGRWNADNWMIITQGLDELGVQLVKEGTIDGCGAYFPEKYGEYAIPGALAYMNGNQVPSHMYVDNVIITPENIDEYYE